MRALTRPWIVAACVATALVGCSDPDHVARDSDPYQACLDRAYSSGYSGTDSLSTLQRGFATDRVGPRGGGPARLNWPQSSADRCNDLRTRGQL